MNDDNPPPNNNKPNKPTEEGGSFNWGFAILIALIIGVLGFSFFGDNISSLSTKPISLNEFEELYKKGNIVLNDGTDSNTLPLKVLIPDSSSNATIAGFYIDPKKEGDTGITSTSKQFRTETGTAMLSEKIKEKLTYYGAETRYIDNLDSVDGLASVPAPSESFSNLAWEETLRYLGQGFIQGSKETPLIVYISKEKVLITGTCNIRHWPSKKDEKNKDKYVPFTVSFNTQFEGERIRSLLEGVASFDTKGDSAWRVLFQFLPILLIILFLFFIIRQQMRSAGKNAMSFGKSRAKLMDGNPKKRVTFKDVAGVTEAKEEVWEIVDFLREPGKFQALGGTIPKGILMVGPPGTGKTLIARAIAGEADVPFFSISGSDFVEMFVGVGASRVRDMFEQAKKNAPCLIFIDEIDAVGRHRGHGVGGGHDEREQTLNALLVEMDGFEGNESVIVIAATNRPDVLDPALLRPGRFDRQVVVNLPDVKGREEILKVHAKKVKMSNDINLALIARGTAGFSGAKLANLINEAALLAVRRGKHAVTQSELEEARDKEGWGKERRSMAISEKEKRVTAYHEAGHAICLLKCKHTEPLHKVTIIPRGPSLGSTMWLPSEDKFTGRYSKFIDQIVVAMGGRCAEEIIFGDITSGASGDIQMATNIARGMVCDYGMSKKLGLVKYGEKSNEVFLARDLGHSRNYSEETAQLIDSEIRRITDEGYQTALSILRENKDKLDIIAEALLEFETLDGSQVKDLLETGTMPLPNREDIPPPIPNDESSQDIAPEYEGDKL